MSRLIDADELIAKCGNWYVEEGTEEGFISDLKHLLDLQPTVPQWIPCSERLPTESDDYLCTYGSLSGWFVDISIYEAEKKEFGFYSENEHGEDVWYPVKNVIAWMPLPEPYQGGEQDG